MLAVVATETTQADCLCLLIDQSWLGRDCLCLPLEGHHDLGEIAYAYRWKDTSYNSILIVIDRLTKMVHSKQAQIINISELAETISDIFQPFLYYYLGVK